MATKATRALCWLAASALSAAATARLDARELRRRRRRPAAGGERLRKGGHRARVAREGVELAELGQHEEQRRALRRHVRRDGEVHLVELLAQQPRARVAVEPAPRRVELALLDEAREHAHALVDVRRHRVDERRARHHQRAARLQRDRDRLRVDLLRRAEGTVGNGEEEQRDGDQDQSK